MDILYEDNHLLVLNKPAGLLTQPSEIIHQSLESEAKAMIKARDNKSGNVFLHAVHRIDKPVSGIVLFAKTSKALSRLNEFLREKKFRKLYHAWVSPAPIVSESELMHYLIHDDHIARIAKKGELGAKEVRLSYRTLFSDQIKNKSLLEILLETGRYHQIRAQLSAIGSPIIGDTKYGSQHLFDGPDKIALHHAELQIIHPITKEVMNFQAETENKI